MDIESGELRSFDCAEVLEFWRGISGVGLNESDCVPRLEKYLSRNPGLSVVARQDGVVVGAVLCGHDGRRGYLQHLAVAPEQRGRGLGSALIRRCLEGLARAGIQRCNVFVYTDNESGQAFWRRQGWNVRGDLLMMQRAVVLEPAESPQTAGGVSQ